MSEQVTASFEKNPLLIDKFGSFAGILRKNNESVVDFKERVIKAYKELYELDNESFWRSLSYITTQKEKNIGFLTVENQLIAGSTITINNEKINVVINEEENNIYFNENKFLIDVINQINQIEGLIFEEINVDDNSWHFCYSRNLIPRNSERIYLKKTISSLIEESPVEYPVEFVKWLEREDNPIITEEGMIESEADEIREGFLRYKNFPLLLTWNPFFALSCNKSEFKNILKSEDGLITQRGAKIINKILEKQNTYWGE